MPLVGQVYRRTRQLTHAIKDVGRLREIASILIAHGFGFLLENVNIPGMGKLKARREAEGNLLSSPERALEVITELGPTFVKIGQILSTRPDLIPPEYINAFQTLQDQVAPLPVEEVRAQIARSLNHAPEELFEQFADEPLASASIAQVHRARLRTGEEVVLKVQRPGVREKILRDLDILSWLARQVEYNFPEAQLVDLAGIVREIEQSIRSETNFLIEAGNLYRFSQNLAGLEGIHIPALYKAFTTAEVLTMEYLDGIKITKAADAGRNMEVIGRRYLDAAYSMLFRDGFFHGDLHPGNVIVLENDVLGFIDFGMVGRLTQEMKNNVVDCMFGLMNMDFETIARIFWDIGVKPETCSYQRFSNDVVEVMQRHLVGKSMADLQMGLFFRDILDGAMRHRIRVPSGYTMMFKALVTTEGMAKMLVPDINPLNTARPYIESLVKDRYSLESFTRQSFFFFSGFGRLLRRLPVALEQLVSDVEDHKLRLTIDVNVPEVLRTELRRTEDRRLMAVVAVGGLVSGTLALNHPSPALGPLPLIASGCYLLSGLLLLLLALGYPRARR